MKQNTKRTISWVAMAIVLCPIIYYGGLLLVALSLGISLGGIIEFCNGWHQKDVHPSKTICFVMTIILFLPNILLYYNTEIYLSSAWLFISLVASFIYALSINKEKACESGVMTIIALLYIPFLSRHLVIIDEEYHPFIWLIFISAFGCDTFAYVTGSILKWLKIKTHKMAPTISPNKTIEGLIGGLVASGFLCLLFGHFFMKDIQIICLFIGLIGGAAGALGDLIASAFKRQMGIKDFGKIIPGHGGILDRFDSVLLVAPTVYYLFKLCCHYRLL